MVSCLGLCIKRFSFTWFLFLVICHLFLSSLILLAFTFDKTVAIAATCGGCCHLFSTISPSWQPSLSFFGKQAVYLLFSSVMMIALWMWPNMECVQIWRWCRKCLQATNGHNCLNSQFTCQTKDLVFYIYNLATWNVGFNSTTLLTGHSCYLHIQCTHKKLNNTHCKCKNCLNIVNQQLL